MVTKVLELDLAAPGIEGLASRAAVVAYAATIRRLSVVSDIELNQLATRLYSAVEDSRGRPVFEPDAPGYTGKTERDNLS